MSSTFTSFSVERNERNPFPLCRPQGINYANQPLSGSSPTPYAPINPSTSARGNPFG